MKKNDWAPDMRVTAEEAAEAIQKLFTDPGISQKDIESSDLLLYDPAIDEAIKHAEKNMVENWEKTKGRNASDPIAINCFECAEEHRQLAEWLKELKQLREQTSWIPVTERLPEDRREVLVTAYWHETYQVMMASYYGDGLWWCVPFNNCGEHTQKLNPKAWMPSPLAYEPQERSIWTKFKTGG